MENGFSNKKLAFAGKFAEISLRRFRVAGCTGRVRERERRFRVGSGPSSPVCRLHSEANRILIRKQIPFKGLFVHGLSVS